MADVAPIFELIHHARRRLRTQRVLERLCTALIAGAAIALVGVHVAHDDTLHGAAIITAAIAAVIVMTVRAATRRIHDDDVAHVLDRATDLDDRLRTAIIFERSVERERCPETAGFMHAAIADGLRAVERVDVVRATPYREPQHAKLAVGVLAVVALVAIVDIPVESSESSVWLGLVDGDPAEILDEATLDHDDLRAFDEGVYDEAANIQMRGEHEHLRPLIEFSAQVTALLRMFEANRIDKVQLLDGVGGAERRVRAALAGVGGGAVSQSLLGDLEDLHEAIARLPPRRTPRPIAKRPPPPPHHPQEPGTPAPPAPVDPSAPGQPGPTTSGPSTERGPQISATRPAPKPSPGTPSTDDAGPHAGTGHDPDSRGMPQQRQQPTVDVALDGVAGRGTSRRETIVSAATQGFAGLPYERVYAQYRVRAEETMHADKVPASYRYFIKRYFRRIHPE